jgi:hypothetical protein
MELKKGIGALIFASLSFAIEIPTDGRKAVEVCVPKGLMFTVQTPCPVLDLYFTSNIKANISNITPSVISGYLFGEKGVLTIACPQKSYTLVVKAGDEKHCDAVIKLVDLSLQKQDLIASGFDKEELINRANSLMVAMVKGINIRGYEIVPYKGVSVLNDDDNLKIEWDKAYVGSKLIGLVGTLKNLSPYLTKYIDIRDIMDKGWVEVYVDGWEKTKSEKPSVELIPLDERKIFVVILRGSKSDKYPFVEGF